MRIFLLLIGLMSTMTVQPMLAAQTDPLDAWHSRQLPFPDGCTDRVAYGNNTFVAMGRDGQSFVSSDGEVWYQTLLSTGVSAGARLSFLTGLFFVTRGTFLTSTDGLIWTEHAGLKPYQLTFGNGMYVGITDYAILVSSNGIDWTTSVTNTANHPIAIAFGSGLFVVVTYEGHILSSPDGRGWTYRRNQFNESPQAIAFGNGRFLVPGDFGYSTAGTLTNFLVSLNGVQWAPVVGPSYLNFTKRSLSFQNGVFLSGGRNNTNGSDTPHILSSVDGISWVEHDLGTNFPRGSVESFACGMGTLVAVGSCFVAQSDPLTNGSPVEVPSLGIRSYPGLTITGTVGKTYSIDYSADAEGTSGWQTITNLLLFSSPSVWVDLEATNSTRRFYRAEAK